ncbi:MAG: hypothetical protein MK212_22185, partial [Saprospiraceae bacterium]|nr:hypothetical protein [Saprospiraceae bacterium]
MNSESILTPLTKQGVFPIIFTGLILILSGIFVITQSITGYFLPHDVNYLGLTAQELGVYNNGKIALFMFHDRVAYGGSIISVGILYMWLAFYPLREGHKWAWQLLLLSGVLGFGSFMSYLGKGYLDTWYGLAAMLLLPIYILGLVRSFSHCKKDTINNTLFRFSLKGDVGKSMISIISISILLAGLVILFLGSTVVFVPTDLAFMEIDLCGLNNISERLVPLIAHDRANFGGGL